MPGQNRHLSPRTPPCRTVVDLLFMPALSPARWPGGPVARWPGGPVARWPGSPVAAAGHV